MKIGERLAKWRSRRGLTQAEAALRAGVSQASWHSIESGRIKRIGLEVARRIVEATEGSVSLDDFPRPPRRTAA